MTETKCKKCGHPSHCETNVTMHVNASEVGINEIIICKDCRCDKCSKERKENNGI